MKRRVTLILLLLLGGAIINIAVAWGCAIYIAPGEGNQVFFGLLPDEVPSWQCIGWQRSGAARIMSQPAEDADQKFGNFIELAEKETGLRRPIFSWSRTSNILSPDIERSERVQVEDARGWPRLGMMWSLSRGMFIDTPTDSEMLRWGIPLKDGPTRVTGADRHRALPLRPVWPGFAINTLFYAALLWMIFVFPFALRRRLRIQRGLCPACAYPAGTSPICTECGAAVSKPDKP